MQRKKTKMTLNIQKLISISLAVIKAHLNKFQCLYEHTASSSFVLMKSRTLMDKSVIYWVFSLGQTNHLLWKRLMIK